MERGHPMALSRRQLLATAGTVGAGLTVEPAVASAQENGTNESGADGSRVTTRAIMPETDRISNDQNYTGLFLHLTARLEDAQVEGVEQCDFANWDPGNTDVYETQLINRIGDDTETVASSAYLPHQTDLRPGDVFVINSQHDCPEGAYIGLRLEQLLARDLDRGYDDVSEGEGDSGGGGGSSGAAGPGFGPLAAVGGIAGGAYALLRRSDGE